MEYNTENTIVKMTFDFSIKVVLFCEVLETNRKFVISNQLLKSGTSIGANVREAQNAENKADFVHKMKIALKEVEETDYWLQICQNIETYPDCEYLIESLLNIKKVLTKIVSSSKKTNP